MAETTLDEYERIMNINMRSTYLPTKAFLPQMVESKIGQVAGYRGGLQETIYVASKFAQCGFAQSLDAEVREKRVKVTYLAPGVVQINFDRDIGRPEKPS